MNISRLMVCVVLLFSGACQLEAKLYTRRELKRFKTPRSLEGFIKVAEKKGDAELAAQLENYKQFLGGPPKKGPAGAGMGEWTWLEKKDGSGKWDWLPEGYEVVKKEGSDAVAAPSKPAEPVKKKAPPPPPTVTPPPPALEPLAAAEMQAAPPEDQGQSDALFADALHAVAIECFIRGKGKVVVGAKEYDLKVPFISYQSFINNTLGAIGQNETLKKRGELSNLLNNTLPAFIQKNLVVQEGDDEYDSLERIYENRETLAQQLQAILQPCLFGAGALLIQDAALLLANLVASQRSVEELPLGRLDQVSTNGAFVQVLEGVVKGRITLVDDFVMELNALRLDPGYALFSRLLNSKKRADVNAEKMAGFKRAENIPAMDVFIGLESADVITPRFLSFTLKSLVVEDAKDLLQKTADRAHATHHLSHPVHH